MTSKDFERAKQVLPGGVSSPVRAFKAVGGDPLFVDSARGPYVFSGEDKYIDLISSWGALLFGHSDPEVIDAITNAARHGTTFGIATRQEAELAELVCEMVPGLEMLRWVSSGTEATMSAIRLCRAATGRDHIVKFDGGYHGHADPFLVSAGSGAATFGVPTSPGVPKAVGALTLQAQYNNLDSLQAALEAAPVAAVIIEPIAGNMGVVAPQPGFLEGVKAACSKAGALLIFDEVMTGFRVSPGGAAQLYSITPDLYTFGKIVGGGLPAAAFGGPRHLMEMIAPVGPVYQAGTLSGNPLAMAAGLATLTKIKREPELYQSLDKKGQAIEDALLKNAANRGVQVSVQRVGSMLTCFFGDPVTNFEDAKACDHAAFASFFQAMLANGILLPPSGYEAWFLNASHDDDVIEQIAEAISGAL